MNIFEKQLLAHTFIECYYANKTNVEYITENLSNKKRLFEQYGVFKGCEDIASYINDIIMSNRNNGGKEKDLTIEIKNCPFIKTVRLKLYRQEDTNTSGAYVPNYSHILVHRDKETRKLIPYFCPLYLEINTATVNCFTSLMHELTHAYEDIMRFKNDGDQIVDKGYKLGYFKRKYNNDDATRAEVAVSQMIYNMASFEQNAYMAQMAGECQSSGKKFVSVKEAFNFIRETFVYKKYKTLIFNLTELERLDDEVAVFYMNVFNDLSNYNFKTPQNFRTFCRRKREKIEKKFNNIVPKIVYEYLMSKKTLPPNLFQPDLRLREK